MRNKLVMLFAVAVALLISVPVFAHHGGASILSGKTLTLKGTVKAWLWSNPHCLLTLDVKGDDGKIVEWVAETQAPSSIYSSGYRKDSFKPGDVVTITVEPVKSGAPNGRIASVILADGTKIGGNAEGGGRGGRGGAGAGTADQY
jgi:Family of unknown function (DUF6152)